jgi:hypothetical protein
MGIDRTFYAIVGVRAEQIELTSDLIEQIRDENVGDLLWIDSNAMSGGQEFVGIGLHSQGHHDLEDRHTELSATSISEAFTKATLELNAIGYEGEVKMYLLMAIS